MSQPKKYAPVDNRKKYYTLLQVGRAKLEWDDEFYYGIWLPMQGATLKDGKYSASTLSNVQLFQAVEVMKKMGFRVKSADANGNKINRPLADDAQSKKIRALWLEMHGQGIVKNPSEASLCAYVKRMTKVDALQWLSVDQASMVIEGLKKWQVRIQKA
ncbi:MAG: regulatory protein GemA [Methylococcaceae bacterium]|nr:regulatory protein GemA [Methylococcaceae bacterium]